MKRLVALGLLFLAGLADAATFLTCSSAFIAAQELNPVGRMIGPTLGILVVKAAAFAAIVAVVLVMARVAPRAAKLPWVGVEFVTALWAFGAWTNVAYGLL